MPLFNFTKKPLLVCRDHTVSGEYFELREDRELDILGTFPPPEEEKLPEYYRSENYISHTDSRKSLFDKAYQSVKSYMLRKKISWIEERAKKGRLLDIGAGTADFLLEAKRRGWRVEGVEPNEEARKLASGKNINLHEDSSSLAGDSFDVITLWHVLEHVPDLEKQIQELNRLLKKDGLLVVAVPNFKSYDARMYREYWAAYDVPRHLYHFSRSGIRNIFQSFSFDLVDTRPLKFDAYYVSLLSEKHKSGRANPVKAFVTATASNFQARSTGEYSSLTYFLKKSGK